MIISTPDPATADGFAAEKYREDLDDDGVVLTHTRAMVVNPDALEAFESLLGAVVPSLGIRTYELVTLAAAGALKSSHCLVAHGRKTLRAGVLDEDQLERVARDYTDAGLDASEVAVMRFATKLSTDAAAMTDADTQELRDAGFTDRQIVDITLAAAARNYFSRALLALAVPLDDMEGLSPRVKDALLSPLSAR